MFFQKPRARLLARFYQISTIINKYLLLFYYYNNVFLFIIIILILFIILLFFPLLYIIYMIKGENTKTRVKDSLNERFMSVFYCVIHMRAYIII